MYHISFLSQRKTFIQPHTKGPPEGGGEGASEIELREGDESRPFLFKNEVVCFVHIPIIVGTTVYLFRLFYP